MTKLIVAIPNYAKAPNNYYNHSVIQISVDAICLCVLQTAVASLQSADCGTEWLICVNVVTEGVLWRKQF